MHGGIFHKRPQTYVRTVFTCHLLKSDFFIWHKLKGDEFRQGVIRSFLIAYTHDLTSVINVTAGANQHTDRR